ncbi:MAG: hypothetical protein K8L97_10870 [Anaerolineae bacterium]|nr:hypothetical protein [Anaerolineae bacterium]
MTSPPPPPPSPSVVITEHPVFSGNGQLVTGNYTASIAATGQPRIAAIHLSNKIRYPRGVPTNIPPRPITRRPIRIFLETGNSQLATQNRQTTVPTLTTLTTFPLNQLSFATKPVRRNRNRRKSRKPFLSFLKTDNRELITTDLLLPAPHPPPASVDNPYATTRNDGQRCPC